MDKRSTLALLLGLVATAAGAQEPDWLKAARAREGELQKPKAIRSTDGFFRAEVPAKVEAKVEPEEGTYLVSMDAKAGATVDCVIFRDGPDLASFLAAAATGAYEAIEGGRGKVDAKVVDGVDAGSIGASPFLAIDWTHRIVGGDGKALVGTLKQFVATKEGHGVYCVHDEVGYARTFRALASALVESLRFEGSPSPRPYRTEISTLAIKGMRVAVDVVTYTLDDDGDTRIQHLSSLAMPVDGATLMTNDDALIQWVRPDGSLISAYGAENVNGQLETTLRLEPGGEGVWKVAGKFKTKPLEVDIAAGSPTSMLRDARELRSRLAGAAPAGTKIKVQTWLPGVDPSKLVDQEMAILRALEDGRFAAKVTMEGLAADLVVDREGSVVSGTMTMGPARMDIQRVFVSGTIPDEAPPEIAITQGR